MKIPESVRINGIEYPVKFVSALNDGERICHGRIFFNTCKIHINAETQGHEKMCVTLLHEILHALLFNGRIELNNEEDVVEVLSNGLYQVLQDNGRRFFDIVKEEKKDEQV